MTNQAVNAFSSGLDKDTDKSIISNSSYTHAENVRLVTDEGQSTGALTNIKGNVDFSQLHLPSDQTIIGHCYIRNDLILFTKGSGTDDHIYRFRLNSTTDIPSVSSSKLICERDDLGFSVSRPIKAIGRYENENIQKIYWSDGESPLRCLNIAATLPDGTVNDSEYIKNIPIDLLEIVPNSMLNTPQLIDVVPGTLPVGVIQYAYQLFVRNGAETTFSPVSPLYHLTRDSEYQTNNRTYRGAPQFDDNGNINNSGKGIRFRINNMDDRFDRVRVVSIYYSSLYSVPEIKIIYEGHFLKNDDPLDNEQSIIVTDTGSSNLGTYSIEELSMIGMLSFSCNTMETKDNRLFIGNVTEDYFNISDSEFDARAYRFNSAESGSGTNINLLVTIGSDRVIFKSNVCFKTTAQVGLPGAPGNWDSFWYYDSPTDTIYLLAPILVDATIDLMSHAVSASATPTGETLDDVYSYSGGMLSFSGRQVICTKNVSTREDVETPIGWIPGGGAEEDEVKHARILGISGNINILEGAISNDPVNWGVPLHHDCINPSNLYDDDLIDGYLYQLDGETLGGEGPNVKYEFKVKTISVDHSGSVTLRPFTLQEQDTLIVGSESHVTKSFPDYSSPFKSGLIRGYQRDEIYRFGIVFFDNKMRPSPVKWVGDIKMPSLSDFPLETADVLYLEFDINIPSSVEEKISGYQIVRCQRRAEDRSVLCQGIISAPHDLDDNEYECDYRPATLANFKDSLSHSANPISNDFINFYSPEVSFNKNILSSSTDYIKIEATYRTPTTHIISDGSAIAYDDGQLRYSKGGQIEALLMPDGPLELGIEESKLIGVVSKDSPFEIIGDYHYRNYVNSDRGVGKVLRGHGGTNLVMKLDDGIVITQDMIDELGLFGEDSVLLGTYKRKVIPYGGNNYSTRSVNSYIIASHFIPVSNEDTITVYGGDTFISFFEFLYSAYDPAISAVERLSYNFSFLIESSINLNLRHDYHYQVSPTTDDKMLYLQESKDVGIGYGELSEDWEYPSRFTDLYLYNSVYSRDSDSKLFYPAPLDYQTVQKFDTRIYSSEMKRNGEYSDSWTRFMANEYIDLDSKYGRLIKLVEYKDRLVFFQEKGLGIASVNYQSVIQDLDSRDIVLGSGGLLDRADYISTDSGTRHDTSVLSTPYGLFWFDSVNKKLYKLGEYEEPLSDIKGLNSYFQHNIAGNILINNNHTSGGSYVISAFDDKFMEILYTFGMSTGSFTICFNIKLDGFVAFYTLVPRKYITFNKELLSSRDLNDLWIHNYGDYCSFYGENPTPSTVSFIINENYWDTKVFDVIQFNSDSLNGTVNIYNDTINIIRCYNDYQNTGYIDLIYGDNIERRERTWSLHVPRNAVNIEVESNPDILNQANLNHDRLFKSRIRDKYLAVDLIYNNENNYKFTIPGIITKYRISSR